MEENIANRLKHFFEFKGITNSQFADACGIPRPSLSQILTGRNKKISDVLIGQIHRTYPEINVMWLLFGEGDMILSADPEGNIECENRDEILNDSTNLPNLDEYREDFAVNGLYEVSNSPVNQQKHYQSPMSHSRAQIVLPAPEPRKISHITVYYDDSTFETFYPKK